MFLTFRKPGMQGLARCDRESSEWVCDSVPLPLELLNSLATIKSSPEPSLRAPTSQNLPKMCFKVPGNTAPFLPSPKKTHSPTPNPGLRSAFGTSTHFMKSSQTSVHTSNAETIPSNPLIKKTQPLCTPSHAANLPLTPFGGGNPTDTDSIPPVKLHSRLRSSSQPPTLLRQFPLHSLKAEQSKAHRTKVKQPEPTHLTY